ncbi:hypothetical protein D9M72_503260 [compost metagenome]
MVTRSELPDVQIDNLGIFLGDDLADFFGQVFAFGKVIQQGCAGVADETEGPARNDDCADDTHGGIEPQPAIDRAQTERDNCENRGQRIGEDVQIGGAQVSILPAMVSMMRPVVIMMVMGVVVLQQPGAHEVDDEAGDGDENRLAKIDRHRSVEAAQAFPADQQSDERQHDGAGKTGQVAKLSGAEGETAIVRMLARIEIGKRGDQHRGRMGRHVPTIGNERHRPEDLPGHDLDHHHRCGDRDDDPGPPLVALVIAAKEDVIVARREHASFAMRMPVVTVVVMMVVLVIAHAAGSNII